MRYFIDSDENLNYYLIPVTHKGDWIDDLHQAVLSADKQKYLEAKYRECKINLNLLSELTFSNPNISGISYDGENTLKIFLYLLVTHYMTLKEVETLMEHTQDFINADVKKTFPFADIFVERLYEKLKD